MTATPSGRRLAYLLVVTMTLSRKVRAEPVTEPHQVTDAVIVHGGRELHVDAETSAIAAFHDEVDLVGLHRGTRGPRPS